MFIEYKHNIRYIDAQVKMRNLTHTFAVFVVYEFKFKGSELTLPRVVVNSLDDASITRLSWVYEYMSICRSLLLLTNHWSHVCICFVVAYQSLFSYLCLFYFR